MNASVRRRLLLFAALLLGVLALAWLIFGDSVAPRYNAKESLLRQDLFSLRQAIDQYTLDKHRAPISLEDLVKGGYLKSIPIDPFTGSRDWKIDKEPQMQDLRSPQILGIVDVHSAAFIKAGDGSLYSSW